MRLPFDQNLAASLVQRLADVYPGSQHVRDVGLGAADDAGVWAYAAEHGLTIVSKDADFHQLSFLKGAPPKAVPLPLLRRKSHGIRGQSAFVSIRRSETMQGGF